ncbi:probable G-protein coupled receptor 34 [Sceloporus undulatus]|uniref:probable G-protein coupled receptor 34 n=1 Tax=Sceloporus undulatus TaxID=8520 RepID=UPI001C4CB785|nr:probable G-protein coupled receptor 34 [Sceloporus undulatus]
MDASKFLNFSLVERDFKDSQNQTGNMFTEIQNVTDCVTTAEKSLSLVLIFSYSIIFVIGLVANVTALYVFLSTHGKNSIQIYLLNVAIADLLLIFCLPFRIFYHATQNTWLLGLTFCKIIGNLFYMNMYISIVLLGLISLDRYIKINRTVQRAKVLTTKQSIYICCTLWTVAITGFTIMVVQSTRKDEKNPTKCFHYRGKQNAKMEAGLNYILVIIFWIVFILLILSYNKIATNLLKMSKKRTRFPSTGKYIAIARNSFIILIIFTLCFVPYHLFRFIYITTQLQDTSCYWKQIIHKCNEVMLLFSAFNSCLDPVMYFLMSRSIRKTVLRLICKRLSIEPNISESTSETKQRHSPHDNLQNPNYHSRICFLKNVR